MVQSRRLRTAGAAFALAAALVSLPLRAPAPAHALGLAQDARVTAIGHTTLTVALPAVDGATAYRLVASPVRSDVYVANIDHPSVHQRRADSATPIVTVALPYTTGPVWYRVAALGPDGRARWAHEFSAPLGLRPAAPSGARAVGATLEWAAAPATGARIVQADDARLRTGRRSYTVRGSTHRFTPYGLVPGRRYWFGITSLTQHTLSAGAATTSLVARGREQPLRVMSYNVLQTKQDGTRDGYGIVAPWSRRVIAAAGLVRVAHPAVLGVQEAWQPVASPARRHCPGSYNRTSHRYNQVASLCDALGGRYRVADTVTATDGSIHWNTGNYLLYDPSRVSPVGRGGFWYLGGGPTAAWAVFAARPTGARVLVVTPHLSAALGAGYDRQRAGQTSRLITYARAQARRAHVTSVVVAGDMNSYPGRVGVPDTAGDRLRAAGWPDAIEVAQARPNAQYNSSNQLQRTPPQGAGSLDHVYVTPTIGVRSFGELLRLAGGRFAGVIPSDHNPVYADLVLRH